MSQSEPHPEPQLEGLSEQLAKWAHGWGVPSLEARLRIVFSSRFRSALGRCTPSVREVRLSSLLLEGPGDLLREVLCHEAAHVAVYELHGAGVRPHGAEWRELMRSAGYEPRARIPLSLLPAPFQQRAMALRVWSHRCPVCQVCRRARRPMPHWRCRACHDAGREGALAISRVSAQTQGDDPLAPRDAV